MKPFSIYKPRSLQINQASVFKFTSTKRPERKELRRELRIIYQLGERTILFLRSLAFLHPVLKNALKARNYLIIPVVHPKTCPRTPTTNERTESGLLENGSLTLLETGLVLTTPLGELEGKEGTEFMPF